MFRQYMSAKAAHQDAILMFRMGDFFEMFFEDAIAAAKILDLALTARGKGTATEAPMCGVPVHAVEGYIAKLVRAGRRVAICDQTEDPRTSRGSFPREVVRVISPGTVTEPGLLEARAANYVAATAVSGRGGARARRPVDGRVPRLGRRPRARAGDPRRLRSARDPAHRGPAPPAGLMGDLAGRALLSPGPDGPSPTSRRARPCSPTSVSRRSMASG
jgi:hypothetical protein